MNRNRIVLTIVLSFVFVFTSFAQYPQEIWYQYEKPEEAGFSSEKLRDAKQHYDGLNAAAFMAVFDGHVLFAWGDIERRFMCHSVRKSLLSALYGIYVDEGMIDLEKTMEDLNIDDQFPLTATEKQARVKDLLKAR